MESYINEKKKLYTTILEFLENSDEDYYDKMNEIFFEKLSPIIQDQAIDKDREEMQEFLQIIKNINENHHRDLIFITKTKQILQHYKDQIKQNMTNNEIFNLFQDNKLLILYLLENDIITMTESICEEMMNKLETNGNRYCHFFIPELEHFLGEEKIKDIKSDLLRKQPTIFEDYEKNRHEGENESPICSMIRKDSVEDFISYVNQKNYSLSSQISPSIFETNSFLINRKKITFIEYSAFFGSIQIFQYLSMNNVEFIPSLWFYVIHSNNAEMIHKLEEKNICPPKFEEEENEEEEENDSNNIYLSCLIESIKCHHKDFADYFKNKIESDQNEQIIVSNYMKYHNYEYFDTETIKNHGFFYSCFYHYDKLVDFLLKLKENIIETKIIQYINEFIERKFHQHQFNKIYKYFF